MKSASLSKRSLGYIFKVCTCVSMVTLVAWNGYNTQKMKKMDKEMKILLSEKDVAMQQIHERVMNVEKRAVEHRILRRTIPRPKNGSSKGETRLLPGGATYTRWGRTTCGPDSELIYEGHAGGSHYSHVGGASNYICLPRRPLWKRGGGCGAYVYGAEYQQTDQFLTTNHEGALGDQNVPCAVCRSKMRSSQIMIPARNVCYPGWSLEYEGYLMTGHHTHKNNFEYICMDEAPEGDPAGFRNEDGALFYAVCAKCGSLPCPSYINDKKLTCAVCTK